VGLHGQEIPKVLRINNKLYLTRRSKGDTDNISRSVEHMPQNFEGLKPLNAYRSQFPLTNDQMVPLSITPFIKNMPCSNYFSPVT